MPAEFPRRHGAWVGRGATASPGNRFERIQFHAEECNDSGEVPRKVATEFFHDDAKSVISSNTSPDIPFRYSLNPYRGCEHGCAYCYARPTHETLGLNAGIDFESKVLVKRNLDLRLRNQLNESRWKGDEVMLSGVTDCYQPAERHFRLTRNVLEIFDEARQAFSIITKNRLVTRDIDLLSSAAKRGLVHVFISITTLDQQLARQMEPRTTHPTSRLQTISDLSAADIPVGVMVAPVIPGLNDREIPEILTAASEAGAMAAGHVLLRLPNSVAPVFEDWLNDVRPQDVERVMGRIRDCRAGELNSSKFGERMSGTGAYAKTISATFTTFSRAVGLDQRLKPLDTSQFRPPRSVSGQGTLF